jgi:hypothetical protein
MDPMNPPDAAPASIAGHPPSISGPVCDLGGLTVETAPFPHVSKDGLVAPSVFERLCETFPACPPSTGPSGFSLYWGDPGYEDLLAASPAWRALFDTFQSQTFVDGVIRQFGDVWQGAGCKIDLGRARYVAYREDRIDKERATLRKVELSPHELWVRMDIHQGRAGYGRAIHLDHARRLVSMLIYFSDQEDDANAGGELLLHAGPRQHWFSRRPKRILPRKNRMVMFPCMRRSFHSVPAVTAAAARTRSWIQVAISSSVDAW